MYLFLKLSVIVVILSCVGGWVLDTFLFDICLPQVESFLLVYSSFLFGAASGGWRTLYKFYLSEFVLVFPFTQVVGIRLCASILLCKTYNIKT